MIARWLAASVIAFGALASVARAVEKHAEPIDAVQVDAGAVAAWRSGDLQAAREQWSALLGRADLPDRERARIAYDLGNAAFRDQRPLEAVGWYTASLRLRPRDADAWANLEHARRVANLEPADRGDLRATLARALASFDPAEARLLALFGLGAWALVLAYEALRGGRAARWAALGGFFLAAACSAPWIAGALGAERNPLLVVAEGGADLLSEPRAGAIAVGRAAAGSVVERTDALPDWVEVRADGAPGWVSAGSVFELRR
jgi:hypothetical protein